MDRVAWQATVHGVTRVGRNLATKERERERSIFCSNDPTLCGLPDEGWEKGEWLNMELMIPSPTQWTWTWANSRREWRTEEPGVLQAMGSQRVRYDLATEQQQQQCLRGEASIKFQKHGVWRTSRFVNAPVLGGIPAPQEQKHLCLGPFQTSLHLAIHLYPWSSPIINLLT